MIGNMIRVSEEELEMFFEYPELLEKKIYDENNSDADWYLDMDKLWEGVQYLLTGKGTAELEEPNTLTRAFFSFQLIDEEQDLGYGPAQYLTSEQVKETNSELQQLDIEALKNTTTGSDMVAKGIYPGIWDKGNTMEHLFDTFREFLAFYQQAAENNQAVVSFIS